MNEQRCTSCQLVLWYREYLDEGRSAAFVARVSTRYSVPTLHRMLKSPDDEIRRACVLALGMLGNESSIPLVGNCLRDEDRCVRLVAEMAFGDLTRRQLGNAAARQLDLVRRHVDGHRYQKAATMLRDLTQTWPNYADAWHLMSIALFCTGQSSAAIRAARTTIRLNPHHYAAYALIARAYLELECSVRALRSFEKSLEINPSQESVRSYVEVLARREKRA